MAPFRLKRSFGIASQRPSSRPVRPSAFNEDRLFTNGSFPIRALVPQITQAVSAFRLTRYWQHLLDAGKYGSLTEIAAADGMDLGQVSRIARLAWLGSGVVEAVAGGQNGLRLESPKKPERAGTAGGVAWMRALTRKA